VHISAKLKNGLSAYRHIHRHTKVKRVYPPVSFRSLGGYKNTGYGIIMRSEYKRNNCKSGTFWKYRITLCLANCCNQKLFLTQERLWCSPDSLSAFKGQSRGREDTKGAGSCGGITPLYQTFLDAPCSELAQQAMMPCAVHPATAKQSDLLNSQQPRTFSSHLY